MQGKNLKDFSSQFRRLERLRRLQELTWSQMAAKLGVSVPMLMLVKSGRRNLSDKILARLEWAEVEAGLKASSKISEAARNVGKRQKVRDQVVTEKDIQNGFFDFKPEYEPELHGYSSPEVIRLEKPDQRARTRLGMIVAKTFDSEIVVLACLPDKYRSEKFLENLAISSRNRLNDCAMALVFGTEWRAKVARLAVESRIGERDVIDQILGRNSAR